MNSCQLYSAQPQSGSESRTNGKNPHPVSFRSQVCAGQRSGRLSSSLRKRLSESLVVSWRKRFFITTGCWFGCEINFITVSLFFVVFFFFSPLTSLKCQSLLHMAMFHQKHKAALKYSKTLTSHFNVSISAAVKRHLTDVEAFLRVFAHHMWILFRTLPRKHTIPLS